MIVSGAKGMAQWVRELTQARGPGFDSVKKPWVAVTFSSVGDGDPRGRLGPAPCQPHSRAASEPHGQDMLKAPIHTLNMRLSGWRQSVARSTYITGYPVYGMEGWWHARGAAGGN